MSKRSKYTTDEKHTIVLEYLEGPLSERNISKAYQISTATLKKCCYNYKKYGIEGLQESHTWKKYNSHKRLNSQSPLEFRTLAA